MENKYNKNMVSENYLISMSKFLANTLIKKGLKLRKELNRKNLSYTKREIIFVCFAFSLQYNMTMADKEHFTYDKEYFFSQLTSAFYDINFKHFCFLFNGDINYLVAGSTLMTGLTINDFFVNYKRINDDWVCDFRDELSRYLDFVSMSAKLHPNFEKEATDFFEKYDRMMKYGLIQYDSFDKNYN